MNMLYISPICVALYVSNLIFQLNCYCSVYKSALWACDHLKLIGRGTVMTSGGCKGYHNDQSRQLVGQRVLIVAACVS